MKQETSYARKGRYYRFYENGIRYTVDAKNLIEARERFNTCKRDMSDSFVHGNKTRPVSKQRKPNIAPSLDILNAFDVGVMLAHAGFATIPAKVLGAFETYEECKAARFGLHSV